MINLNREKGVTLVSLTVTIIVLLILVGVTLVILNGFLTDRIATVSSKTTEAFLTEKIEMAFMENKTAYESEKEKTSQNKSEYFVQNLKKSLENSADIKEVVVEGKAEESIKIRLNYHNQKYEFEISSDGEVDLLTSLIGNVKVGDYVEYPIQYVDIYSEKQYTSADGWRVIDDGVMEGTSGFVKLISAGIPAKWFYDKSEYPNGEAVVDTLTNHFEESILLDQITEKVNGNIFKVENIARKVTILSLSDLNKAYNALYKTSRSLDDVSAFEDHSELFMQKGSAPFFYWLSSKEEMGDKICYVCDEGIQYEMDCRMGIRPVIILENDVKYKLENNVWKIIK